MVMMMDLPKKKIVCQIVQMFRGGTNKNSISSQNILKINE